MLLKSGCTSLSTQLDASFCLYQVTHLSRVCACTTSSVCLHQLPRLPACLHQPTLSACLHPLPRLPTWSTQVCLQVTWGAMSPTARGLGPQLGGWAVCYAFLNLAFLYCEPTERTHQLISKCNALIMLVWWPVVWYGAMLPNEDYSPIGFTTYLKSMSIGETVLGMIYLFCGWCVPTATSEHTQDYQTAYGSTNTSGFRISKHGECFGV